jgi:formamidopyrimidine-DNA glycosylase
LARSDDRRIVRPAAPSTLERALTGKSVRGVSRRGKWLRIELDRGGRLYSHLGMTGDWVRRDVDAPPQRSERARIDVVGRGGRRLSIRYLDSRRFGRLIVADGDIPEWSELGPDPLVDGIDVRSLSQALGRTRRTIKESLMDQSVLAGIGNILATEALWRARIDPRSRSDALSGRDIAGVARALEAEIGAELASRARSGAPAREDGGPDERAVFSAYGRAGEACRRCGARFRHLVLGGRGTTYCPQCQIRRIAARAK